MSGIDRIEFRRGDEEYGVSCGDGSTFPSARVLINGVELTQLWDQATGAGDAGEMLALMAVDAGEDFGIWGPHPPSLNRVFEVPDGFVPVVTCSCGTFGCGGGYGRVTFRADTVVWHDFRRATYDHPVPVGYFTFDREQYEEARRLAPKKG